MTDEIELLVQAESLEAKVADLRRRIEEELAAQVDEAIERCLDASGS